MPVEVEAAQVIKPAPDILWDKIVSIEPLPPERVYDIEVEGTHNFIGNGIFAHNTYIGGQGSGDRVPGEPVTARPSASEGVLSDPAKGRGAEGPATGAGAAGETSEGTVATVNPLLNTPPQMNQPAPPLWLGGEPPDLGKLQAILARAEIDLSEPEVQNQLLFALGLEPTSEKYQVARRITVRLTRQQLIELKTLAENLPPGVKEKVIAVINELLGEEPVVSISPDAPPAVGVGQAEVAAIAEEVAENRKHVGAEEIIHGAMHKEVQVPPVNPQRDGKETVAVAEPDAGSSGEAAPIHDAIVNAQGIAATDPQRAAQMIVAAVKNNSIAEEHFTQNDRDYAADILRRVGCVALADVLRSGNYEELSGALDEAEKSLGQFIQPPPAATAAARGEIPIREAELARIDLFTDVSTLESIAKQVADLRKRMEQERKRGSGWIHIVPTSTPGEAEAFNSSWSSTIPGNYRIQFRGNTYIFSIWVWEKMSAWANRSRDFETAGNFVARKIEGGYEILDFIPLGSFVGDPVLQETGQTDLQTTQSVMRSFSDLGMVVTEEAVQEIGFDMQAQRRLARLVLPQGDLPAEDWLVIASHSHHRQSAYSTSASKGDKLAAGPKVNFVFCVQTRTGYLYDQEGSSEVKQTKDDSEIAKGERLNLQGETPLAAGAGASGLGGIDLTTLPMVTQPLPLTQAQPSSLRYTLNGARYRQSAINLQEEWLQIQRMLQGGIIPSSQKIKEYLITSSAGNDAQAQADKILSCIADILRLEEERCCNTDARLRQILVLLESDKPINELGIELVKI